MSDIISRQAAIDEIDEGAELIRRVLDNMELVGGERSKFAWGLGLLESCIDALNELPSVQPERKTGEWIEHNPHKWGLGIIFECTECGYEVDCEEPNFCPNCGADMRGENNE